MKRYEEGLSALDSVPDTFETKQDVFISLLWGLSAVLMTCSEYDRVVDICSRVLSRSSNFVDAMVRRGEALRKLKRYQDSISDFAKAMTIAPSDAKVLRGMRLGIMGLNTGHVPEDEERSNEDRETESRLARERQMEQERAAREREDLERAAREREEQERAARAREELERLQHQRKIEHEERILRLKQERMDRERIRKANERIQREREEEEERMRVLKEKEKIEREKQRLLKEKQDREKERKERERFVSYTSLLQPRDDLVEFLVNCLSKNIFLRATLVRVNILDFEDVAQFDLSLYDTAYISIQ